MYENALHFMPIDPTLNIYIMKRDRNEKTGSQLTYIFTAARKCMIWIYMPCYEMGNVTTTGTNVCVPLYCSMINLSVG